MNNDVVILELDRPRVLKYGYKALKTLVAMTGKEIDDIVSSENMNFEDIEKIIYCGLLSDARANNEDLKLEQMEDLLELKPFNYTMKKMTEAFTASFGDQEDIVKNVKRIAQKKK
jgi:hypothetical protein